jgi:hypothetical protein
MKKTILIGTIMVLTIFLGLGVLYAYYCYYWGMGPSMIDPGSRWWQGYGPQQQRGWFCPWYRGGLGWGIGPGMMGYKGMHHHGGSMGPSYGPPGTQQGQPLSKDQAKALLENYLQSTNNPNLKLGDLSEKEDFYEADIVTKDGSLVDKIQVHKYTGWFRSGYSY